MRVHTYVSVCVCVCMHVYVYVCTCTSRWVCLFCVCVRVLCACLPVHMTVCVVHLWCRYVNKQSALSKRGKNNASYFGIQHRKHETPKTFSISHFAGAGGFGVSE
jgi:hypothetical protein